MKATKKGRIENSAPLITRRLLASWVDIFALHLPVILLISTPLAILLTYGFPLGDKNNASTMDSITQLAVGTWAITSIIVESFLLMRLGGTFGHRMLGLRVVSDSRELLALRTVIKFIPLLVAAFWWQIVIIYAAINLFTLIRFRVTMYDKFARTSISRL